MTDILATTTSILDLLVPHEASERVRVLSAVRAVLDLSEERGGMHGEHGVRVGRVDLVGNVCLPKPSKEKPAQRAPKARCQNQPSELRVRLRKEVPAVLKGSDPMAPVDLARLLNVPKSKKSTLAATLQDLLRTGDVKATGKTAGRRYTTP